MMSTAQKSRAKLARQMAHIVREVLRQAGYDLQVRAMRRSVVVVLPALQLTTSEAHELHGAVRQLVRPFSTRDCDIAIAG